MLNIDYFNPVVDDWNDECKKNELRERENCDFCLYVITSDMIGFYSIAEVIDDSNKRPEKTVFFVNYSGFNIKQRNSFDVISSMVERNGGKVIKDSLQHIANYLNN